MLEVILDTETTGLSTAEKHKIVEIGCLELNDQIPTNNIFHTYINPQRTVSDDAYKVHGYTNKFLSEQKTFAEISRASIHNDFCNKTESKINRAPAGVDHEQYSVSTP